MTADSVEDRFWSKVDQGGECWVWTGCKTPAGYGQFHVAGSGPKRDRTYAHRWSYERAHGPIPAGMEVDHVCRNRSCVRPAHLEAVRHGVNHARRTGFKTGPYNVGTHCKHGHERTPENTGVNATGARFCRLCARAATARARRRRSTPPK